MKGIYYTFFYDDKAKGIELKVRANSKLHAIHILRQVVEPERLKMWYLGQIDESRDCWMDVETIQKVEGVKAVIE